MADYDKHLPQVVGAYNTTQNSTTGISCFMMLTGREKAMRLTCSYIEYEGQMPSFQDHLRDAIKRQQELIDLSRRNTAQAQTRQRKKIRREETTSSAVHRGTLCMVISECHSAKRKESVIEELERTSHDERYTSKVGSIDKRYTSKVDSIARARDIKI